VARTSRPKAKKTPRPPRRRLSMPKLPTLPPGVVKAIALVAVAALGVALLHGMRASLHHDPAYSKTRARVRLVDVPDWMPADIAQSILADIHLAASGKGSGRCVLDAGLARDVYDRAAANPWVARVHRVTKHGDGSVRVRADYRRPFALVRSAALPPQRLIVIDADAVVLPLPAYRVRRDSLVVIGDVTDPPPPDGKKWDAPDLADGLRLLKLVEPRPYATEITTIDVRNHNGRVSPAEPHLRMYAQIGRGRATDIRFGRFPTADDYCVSPQRKLAYLDKYYSDNGQRLSGTNDYLDLRYDSLHVSLN